MRSFLVVVLSFITVVAFADTATSSGSSSQTIEMAQQRSRSAIRIGILGGMNLGNVGFSNGTVSDSNNQRSGVAAGIFTEISLNDYLSLQPELMYVQKGTTENGTSDVIRLDYLELPVLLKVKVGNEQARFVAMAGPSIGLALNRQVANTASGATGSIENQVKDIDFGIQGGVGGELDVSQSVALFVNARYMQGLMDIDNTPSTVTARTRGFLFLTGASFAL